MAKRLARRARVRKAAHKTRPPRIWFDDGEACHIYEWLRMYWRDDEQRFGGCYECEDLGKRLEEFIGTYEVRRIAQVVRRPRTEHHKHSFHITESMWAQMQPLDQAPKYVQKAIRGLIHGLRQMNEEGKKKPSGTRKRRVRLKVARKTR